jgi:hypothetical protein
VDLTQMPYRARTSPFRQSKRSLPVLPSMSIKAAVSPSSGALILASTLPKIT